MKIAFFHELHAGGARRASNEFAKNLIASGNEVDLYVSDEKFNEKESEFYDKIHFYKFIPIKYSGKNWKIKLYKDSIELIKLYLFHKKIAKDIDSRNYDLVFVQGSKLTQAPFLLRFLKTNSVYYCQERLRIVYEELLDVDKTLPKHKYMYEKLNRKIRKLIDVENIKHAGKILANSKFTKENILKSYGLNAEVSYMGVDVNKFKPVKIAKENDVLYIGAFAEADGYKELEKILDFPKEFKHAMLIQERKWIDNDFELSKLYCKSKILLGLSYNEPFGLLPLEAMACGLPVVAVDEGGYKETVKNGKTGLLLERNPKLIYKEILSILKNKKMYEEFSKNAILEMKQNWTWEKRTKELETKLLKLL